MTARNRNPDVGQHAQRRSRASRHGFTVSLSMEYAAGQEIQRAEIMVAGRLGDSAMDVVGTAMALLTAVREARMV